MRTDVGDAGQRIAELHGRSLDFLVLGVARSGTTALGQALNEHPNVFCLIEAFGPRNTTARLNVGAELTRRPALFDLTRPFFRMTAPVAFLVGNKNPEYIFDIARLAVANPQAKLVFAYRSCRDFINSWNVFDDEHEQIRGWMPGRRGLFGVWHKLVALMELAHLDREVLFYNYKNLHSAETSMDALYRHIGVEPSDQALPGLRAISATARELAAKPRPIAPNEQTFLDEIRYEKVDGLFESEEAIALSKIQRDIQAYIEALPSSTLPCFIRCLGEYENWQTARYLRKMVLKKNARRTVLRDALGYKAVAAAIGKLPRQTKIQKSVLGMDDEAIFAPFWRAAARL